MRTLPAQYRPAVIALAAIALVAALVMVVTARASAATYCATSPHTCGYPDGTTTGWTGPGTLVNGNVFLTTANATYQNMDVRGTIYVEASGITLNNDRVEVGGSDAIGIALEPQASNTTITNSTIRGLGTTASTAMEVGVKDIQGTPVTGLFMRYDSLYDMGDGVQMYDGTIEDSYLHDFLDLNGWHLEGYNSTGNCGDCAPPYGPHPVRIWHDTILNDNSQTAAVYEGADFSPSQNIYTNNSLLAGGGYTVYGGAVGVGSQANPSDIHFTNNMFSKVYFPSYGFYGVCAYYSATAPGDQWSGNVDDNGVTGGGSAVSC